MDPAVTKSELLQRALRGEDDRDGSDDDGDDDDVFGDSKGADVDELLSRQVEKRTWTGYCTVRVVGIASATPALSRAPSCAYLLTPGHRTPSTTSSRRPQGLPPSPPGTGHRSCPRYWDHRSAATCTKSKAVDPNSFLHSGGRASGSRGARRPDRRPTATSPSPAARRTTRSARAA